MNEITMIPVDQLIHHPNNPRLDLGDLTELAMRPYRTKYRLPGDEAMRDGLTDVIRQVEEGRPMDGSGERNMARTDDCPALFVTRSLERFNTGGIRDMLKRLEERSGVEHIHPHKFRRTLATSLGHENIETTMQYIVMNKDNTKMQYRQYYAV